MIHSSWVKQLSSDTGYLFNSNPSIVHKQNILGLDLDSTLVVTKSGKKFSETPEDWKFWNSKVVEKLQDYQNDGYKIVIFTNQKGITSKQYSESKCDEFLKRIELIDKKLSKYNVYIQVFASISNNFYRKPLPGLWDLLKQNNGGIEIDYKNCLYIGDAAGRQDNWKKDVKKDFSCSDRQFALNIGIDFKTPDEFFNGEEPAKYCLGDIDMKTMKPIKNRLDYLEIQFPFKKEMIIFVASPGSGKTSFYKTYLKPKGYVHINRDTLKTKTKCISETKKLIQSNSIVIDNTNPAITDRETYISIAKALDIKVRCFWFNQERVISEHLNAYRRYMSNGEIHIPEIAYHKYYKLFEKPTLKEGFSDIVEIPFLLEEGMVQTKQQKQYFYYLY
ncbi:Polynucleotide kinase-3'-phosphatase [Entamoeba marina]